MRLEKYFVNSIYILVLSQSYILHMPNKDKTTTTTTKYSWFHEICVINLTRIHAKTRNSPLTIFFSPNQLYFVKPLLSRNFCQKCVRENSSTVHTVWKLQKFSLTLFSQKFRESNGFTKEITKELNWRNFFSVRENFFFFPTMWNDF